MIGYGVKNGENGEESLYLNDEVLEVYISHAKDCAWCEERSKSIGFEEACKYCEREGKPNCPVDSEIGDSADFYNTVVKALVILKHLPDDKLQYEPVEETIKRACPFCVERLNMDEEYDICTKYGTNSEKLTSICRPSADCATKSFPF